MSQLEKKLIKAVSLIFACQVKEEHREIHTFIQIECLSCASYCALQGTQSINLLPKNSQSTEDDRTDSSLQWKVIPYICVVPQEIISKGNHEYE